MPMIEQTQAFLDLGIALTLNTWPTLTLCVQNQFGGPDSKDKRDWFAGAVSDLFTTNPETDQEDLETVLLQVMLDEFEVVVDDDSAWEIAETIMRIKKDCERGNFAEVQEMNRRWIERGGKEIEVSGKVVTQEGDDEDSEEDDSEDDDEDVEMGEAPAPKEKAPPQIDDDGFETVVNKKRR